MLYAFCSRSPSSAGRGPRRAAAPCGACVDAGKPQSRVTSTPCAVRALHSPFPAALAEGRAKRPHHVPPPAHHCPPKALYWVPGPKSRGVHDVHKPCMLPNMACTVCRQISCDPCRMAVTGTAFLLGKLEWSVGKENEIKSSPFIVRAIYDAHPSNILVTYACETAVSSLLVLTRCGCEWTSNTASSIHARARILLPAAKLSVISGDIIRQALS